MKPERWERLKELFQSALEREPGRRSEYLKEACAGDDSLREEVESMMAENEKKEAGSAGDEEQAGAEEETEDK